MNQTTQTQISYKINNKKKKKKKHRFAKKQKKSQICKDTGRDLQNFCVTRPRIVT